MFSLIHDLTPYLEQLEGACEHELFDLTVPTIVDQVALGSLLAVKIGRWGLAILQIIETKAGKTLTVVAIIGIEMGIWLADMVAFLDRLAADQGCTQVLAWGRPGWERALKKHGYTKRISALTRAIA